MLHVFVVTVAAVVSIAVVVVAIAVVVAAVAVVVAFFFFFFFKCNRTIGSRSIGHRVWSMSLNTLTELSVN